MKKSHLIENYLNNFMLVLEGPNTPNTVQAKIDDLMREVMSVENEIVDTDVEETNIQPEKPVKRVGKSNLSHTICSVVTMEILDMLPLTTVDDVDNLACDVMDEDIKLQYVSYLENYISRNPEITIKKMLGSVFSEELISEYAWFGGKKKRAVKDLSFIQIMEDVIRGAFPYLRKHFFKRETGAYLRRYMLTRKSTRSESTRNDE